MTNSFTIPNIGVKKESAENLYVDNKQIEINDCSNTSMFPETIPEENSANNIVLNRKIKEYNELIDSIENLKFSDVQKEQVVRKKHKIANVLNRIGIIGCSVSMLSVGGFLLSALGAPEGIVPCLIAAGAGLAVGLACGIPSIRYINKKVKEIPDNELVEYYSQKAQELKQEIDTLKTELNYVV